MSLLYDDIRAGRVALKPPDSLRTDAGSMVMWQGYAEKWKACLPRCQVFRISNVSNYYWEERCQTWDLTKDFPNLAPPFNEFWMEYEPPLRIKELVGTEFEMKDSRGGWGRTGILLIGDLSDDLPEKFTLSFTSFCQDEPDKLSDVVVGGGLGRFSLDAEGRVLKCDRMAWRVTDEAERNGAVLKAIPAFLAVSFLHCKNVHTESKYPELKVSRKFQKKTGKPLTSFKVLEIEPMKRILRHEGQSESTGLKKALHVCRGHFKDYREHGIGRYHAKGLWWWDAQVRGTISEGVADKDYDVKPQRN